MTSLFLAPHNDDETLFGAFTLLRHKPLVVVVFKSDIQEKRGTGITAAMREAETAAAMEVLGCEWQQWPLLDSGSEANGWTADDIFARLEMLDGLAGDLAEDGSGSLGYDRVFAPAVEEGGHAQHNLVGEIADNLFGGRVTHYKTYTNGRGRSEGVPVEYENEWIGLKLCALSQYASQIAEPSTGHHFAQALTEWYEA